MSENVSPTGPSIHSFSFEGKGFEYFKIWIVNILLSVITLGIYSAWAKVRTRRYFYGNTFLNDASFEYHAKPITILKGRLIAFGFVILYALLSQFFPAAGFVLAIIIACVSPWVVWRALKFDLAVTSYRQVRFSYQGGLKSLFMILLVIPFAPVILALLIGGALYLVGNTLVATLLVPVGFLLLYVMIPCVQAMFAHEHLNHSRYGQGKFHGEIKAKAYYIIYLKVIALSLLMVAAMVAVSMLVLGLDLSTLANAGKNPQALSGISAASLAIPVLFVVGNIWLMAYFLSSMRNYYFNRVHLDDVMSLKTHGLTTGRIFTFSLTNFVLMIITLGLAKPWIDVRGARLAADTLNAEFTKDPSHYITQQQANTNALGDEVGEAFDIGAGVEMSF